jgi:hypothetical protein
MEAEKVRFEAVGTTRSSLRDNYLWSAGALVV